MVTGLASVTVRFLLASIGSEHRLHIILLTQSCRVIVEEPMCRNIRTLFNFAPPATDDEIRAAALQFVRKLSGYTRPAKAQRGGVQPRDRRDRGCGQPPADVARDHEPAARPRRRGREGEGALEGALRAGGRRIA